MRDCDERVDRLAKLIRKRVHQEIEGLFVGRSPMPQHHPAFNDMLHMSTTIVMTKTMHLIERVAKVDMEIANRVLRRMFDMEGWEIDIEEET